MNVNTILRSKGTDVVTVVPEDLVLTAVEKMTEHNIGLVVVCDTENRVVGVFSERDLARAVGLHGQPALEMEVSKIMTRDIDVCTMQDGVESVIELMTKGRFRHVPVCGGGKLAGIISSKDILRYLNENASSQERAIMFSKIAWV